MIETIIGDADFAAAAGDVLHTREIDDVVVLVDPDAALGARPTSSPSESPAAAAPVAEPSGRFLGAKFRDRDSEGVILFSPKAPSPMARLRRNKNRDPEPVRSRGRRAPIIELNEMTKVYPGGHMALDRV